MDFQQLMKQAAANQSYTQKKHEQKKRQQEEVKNREEVEKREKGKKASALLHDMKKASEKKEKEYRGIVNSRAEEYVKAVAERSSTASSDHCKRDLNRTTPSNARPHPLATTTSSKQTVGDNKKPHHQSSSTKGKTKASSTSTPSSSTSSKSSLTRPSSRDQKSLTKTSKSAPLSRGAHTSSSAVSQTPPKPSPSSSRTQSRPQAKVKQPVNFQDLMKMAEKKSTVSPDSGRTRGGATAVGSGSSSTMKHEKGRRDERGEGRSQSSSPLGKQLLERTRGRGRHKNGGVEGRGGGGAGVGRGGGRGNISEIDERALSPGSSMTDGAKLKELAKSRIVGRGGASNDPGRGRKTGRSEEGEKSGRMPESAILMRERFRKELEASVNGSRGSTNSKTGGTDNTTPPSAKSNSFYASSHSELSKNGRPNFSRKKKMSGGGVGGPYNNSWVSEMNDYAEKVRDRESYSDEEDEEEDDLDDLDDLKGFVVDDEEGDDVSSAIREIFGYDKRRYRDEDDDDRMMESSYAQQQYEEMRSSRIGRQEDEEDIRRENERLARKRKKPGKGSSLARGPKQSKISF